jgi:hypothetical protein
VHAACDLAQRVADLERLNGMHKAAWLAYQPLGDYMQALSMTRKLPVGTLGCHLGDVAIEHMRSQEARIADLAEAHAQRLTLQHHAADQVWRIADLEVERNEWRRIASAYSPAKELAASLKQAKASGDAARKERDELRAKYDELLVALHGIGAALGIQEGDRSPYSVTCGVLERVNRLAEIEAQEPVAWVLHSTSRRPRPYVVGHRKHLPGSGSDLVDMGLDHLDPLYARPVPAQAVPNADGARFRWLCEDHSDRETRERCRSLIDRLPVMSYSDAVMSIDAAMAAAPEHKA